MAALFKEFRAEITNPTSVYHKVVVQYIIIIIIIHFGKELYVLSLLDINHIFA
jgi:hypothetical protein